MQGDRVGGANMASILAVSLVAALAGLIGVQSRAEATSVVCVDAASSERDAARIALACNRFVEVSSSVSERSRVVALPSGVLEWQEFAVPVRVRRGDGWVPVDTGLQVFADGRIGPRASTVDIRLSPGGSGALVTMSAGGGSVSLLWPTALPTPVLEGDTAVYRDVAPDIDLRLRATATGFTHVLVIKTAAAAANPMLRAIRYGWSAQGLQLRSRADGGVDLADSAGTVVLSAAPGSMWDSGTGTPTGAQARMLSGAEGTTSTADGSDATGAGDLARVAPVQVQVSASELTVVPDAAMLSGEDVVFPLYVDPPFNVNKNRWGYANTGGHNQNDGVARVGKNPECCGGVWRSYFEFNISPFAGKTVYDTRFYITATHSSPCAATPVSLWVTGDMQSVPDGTRTGWAPTMYSWADEKSVAANAGCSGVTSPVPMEFGYNLYYHVRWRTDRAYSKVTLGLATYNQDGYGESVDYWKKFDPATASMKIWYNTHPGTPQLQSFSATSECLKDTAKDYCKSTTAASASTHQAQGWWKLNETSGATAADAASPAHPLSKAGSGTVGWADGGATFSNAYLQASTKVVDTSKSFTVSAWAKLADTNGFHTIVSQDGGTVSGFHLRFDWSKQRWVFLRHAADSGGSERIYAESAAAVQLNTWVHLVGVYVNESREKSISLYLNGVRQSTMWAETVFSAMGPLAVGRAKWEGGVSDVFAGGIDNVQAYQRQLNDTDVSALYQASRPGGALNIAPAHVRTATPTLSFKVSDAEAGAKLWSDVEIRTAPVETGTPVHMAAGLGGAAGVSSGTVMTHAVPSGKLTNGTAYYWRARSRDEENWYGFWSPFQAVKVDTSRPTFGSPPVASTQYPQQQWGAVVGTAGSFTFKASTDTYQFQWSVDGVAQPAAGASNGTATVSYTPAKDMIRTLTVSAKDTAGNMSDPYSYQFWVTPAPNRCFNWRMDEPSGTKAYDRGNTDPDDVICGPIGASVAAMDATVSGSTTWVQGNVNGGLSLNSASAHAATTGPVLDTSKSFTVMAWVWLDSFTTGDVQTVLSQAGANISGFALQYRKDANGGTGGWCMTMRASDSASAAMTSACATTAPQAGQWVHLAGVYDKFAGKVRVYVGGDPTECNGRMKELSFGTPWSAKGSLLMGRGGTAVTAAEPWKGDVDDVYALPKVLAGEDICIRSRM